MAKVLEGKIEGKKKRGRPRNNYVTQICKDVGTRTYAEMKRMTENREQWRGMIRQLHTSPRTV